MPNKIASLNPFKKFINDHHISYQVIGNALNLLASHGTGIHKRNIQGLADLFNILQENDYINFRLLIAARLEESQGYVASLLTTLESNTTIAEFDLLYEVYVILQELVSEVSVRR